jgi:hypothetical protein
VEVDRQIRAAHADIDVLRFLKLPKVGCTLHCRFTVASRLEAPAGWGVLRSWWTGCVHLLIASRDVPKVTNRPTSGLSTLATCWDVQALHCSSTEMCSV